MAEKKEEKKEVKGCVATGKIGPGQTTTTVNIAQDAPSAMQGKKK